jgi:hypothetical protein
MRSKRFVALPHEDVTLQHADALDVDQLFAQLGESVGREPELAAQRTQRYAPGLLEKHARSLDRV